MAFWILSVGMLISRAFCIARRSRKLPSTLPPPSFAAIRISRAALVKAWPRLASTMAFLCLMPAHFEWPDIYFCPPWCAPNMYSMILSHANSNEISFAGLQDVAVLKLRIGICLFAVDADATLVDEAPGIATALAKAGLNDRRHEVLRVLGGQLLDLVRNLALSKS